MRSRHLWYGRWALTPSALNSRESTWADWIRTLLLVLASIALAAILAAGGTFELYRFSSPGGDFIDLVFAITCGVFAVCSVVVGLFITGVMIFVALSSVLGR
jgi:hypothetical protein